MQEVLLIYAETDDFYDLCFELIFHLGTKWDTFLLVCSLLLNQNIFSLLLKRTKCFFFNFIYIYDTSIIAMKSLYSQN